jgi:hypothetical protein
MDEYLDDNKSTQEERPQMLLVLCVLSWVYIGFSLITNIMALLRGPISVERMDEAKADMLGLIKEAQSAGMDSIADLFSKLQHMTEVYNAHHYAFYSIIISIFAIGLYGVIQMFLGKRLGFHIYIGYCILSAIHVYFFLTPAEIPSIITIFGISISVLFIYLYSRNLNWMK